MSTKVTRLAGFGLAAVLLLLTAFAVGATIVNAQTVTEANRATVLSAAYERARFAVGEEESLERKYRLEPGSAIRVKYRRAVAGVLAAMRDVARTGTKRDGRIAHAVLLEHKPYLRGIGRMFDAIDRGDTRTVLRIDSTEVDPVFHQIETWVHNAAARNRLEAEEALLDSKEVSRQIVWLASGVFTIGLVLLALLWALRRREQMAATTRLAEDNHLLADQAERLRRTLAARELAERELAETQERLRHGQRLESVGQLAGGVAHDFNNLLQIILGYCSMLELKVPDDSREEVAGIATAAGRGAELTRQLLAFGRRQTLKSDVWDVNTIVADVESMLKRIVPSQIDFSALPSKTELRAHVDSGQLEQVLVNLVLNARDAMPDGGTLTIFTEPMELDRSLVLEGVELPQGAYVRIAVRDTGCGMNEETKVRAFEPFFTTKERGRGTGLGLATVYGIVRQSGGFVSLDSTEGAGTEISVCLPRTLDPLASVPRSHATVPPHVQAVGHVLLVEDDTAVRSILARYLKGQGYEVIEAADGLQGLEAFREHRGDIDVVVTDIVMPQLDGWGLVDELRRVGESVPIVVMSGFAGETQGLADDRLVHLMKPFELDEVARAIARFLVLPEVTKLH